MTRLVTRLVTRRCACRTGGRTVDFGSKLTMGRSHGSEMRSPDRGGSGHAEGELAGGGMRAAVVLGSRFSRPPGRV